MVTSAGDRVCVVWDDVSGGNGGMVFLDASLSSRWDWVKEANGYVKGSSAKWSALPEYNSL